MKVSLHNFRKFEDATFEFSDDFGITLISANSGAGKSTIFNAISFAITGHRTTRSIITRGKNKCSVETRI